MEFTVEFYVNASGRSPVQEFLDELKQSDPDDFAVVLAGLAKLRNRQYHREPLTKAILPLSSCSISKTFPRARLAKGTVPLRLERAATKTIAAAKRGYSMMPSAFMLAALRRIMSSSYCARAPSSCRSQGVR